MIMRTVQSSNIERIGYDSEKKILKIQFKGARNNEKYCYRNVDPTIFEGLRKASSVGKFFHSDIKDRYEFYKEQDV